MIDVVAFGAHTASWRTQRVLVDQAHAWFARAVRALAKGGGATANRDKDALTMGVAAARDCLSARRDCQRLPMISHRFRALGA